jgi:hypothetical protein
MEARVGEEIVIDSVKLGGQRRTGQILEVRGAKGREHYRVRWDDGRETIYFPGPDAHVKHPGAAS